MKPDVSLLLVRHGTTKLNNADPKLDRVKGMKDVPLDDEGVQVAHGAAAALKPYKITHVITSDLSRSVQTGQIIAGTLGAQLASSPKLRPWDVGKMAGKKYTDVGDLMDHYQKNPDEVPPGGESYNTYFNRFKQAMPELLDFAQQNNSRVAAVLHSRHFLALDAVMRGEDTSKIKVSGAPAPGAVVALHVQKPK